MDYRNKNILAPMVRVGTLPMRLLALRYGADIVYTEELIDYKILQCRRVENVILGTVDFVWTDGTIIFRTTPEEKGRLVLQLGTSDAERAVKAAKMVEKDVDGIDVNMGCPKEFSVKGGMGAALLKEPQKAREILTALVGAMTVPVTCKIRILDTVEETLEFVRVVESTGIKALGVHGRRKDERPRHSNRNDIIKIVAQSAKIPVIANGGSSEIKTYEDIGKFREDTGASSVMIARRAEWNVSIFRRDGVLPLQDVILEYLKLAIEYDSHEMNLKYCLQQMLHEKLDTPLGRALLAAPNVREICSLWDMEKAHFDAVASRKRREAELQARSGPTSTYKRRRLDDGSEVIEMPFKFQRKEYPKTTGPKMILYQWTKKQNLPNAEYNTIQDPKDRMFHSVVDVDGKKFGSTWWEKSKKHAEQAAAAVFLSYMGVHDGRQIPDNDGHGLDFTATGTDTATSERSFCDRLVASDSRKLGCDINEPQEKIATIHEGSASCANSCNIVVDNAKDQSDVVEAKLEARRNSTSIYSVNHEKDEGLR